MDKKCVLFGEHVFQPWKNYSIVKNTREGAKKYVLGPHAKTPLWWNDYNSVKHDRTGRYERHSLNYSKANLKNLFYAFSALFSLEIKLMEIAKTHDDDTISTGMESQLFSEQVSFYTYLLRV